jgi:hypothetical protein
MESTTAPLPAAGSEEEFTGSNRGSKRQQSASLNHAESHREAPERPRE